MNFWVSKIQRISWAADRLLASPRRTLLHGVSQYDSIYMRCEFNKLATWKQEKQDNLNFRGTNPSYIYASRTNKPSSGCVQHCIKIQVCNGDWQSLRTDISVLLQMLMFWEKLSTYVQESRKTELFCCRLLVIQRARYEGHGYFIYLKLRMTNLM
jgi:hypothetical protein